MERPGKKSPQNQPDLVLVGAAWGIDQANLWKSALHAGGINSWFADERGDFVFMQTAGPIGLIYVYVPRTEEAHAKHVLEPWTNDRRDAKSKPAPMLLSIGILAVVVLVVVLVVALAALLTY